MGHVIRLFGDRHAQSELLLPWYVTGRLNADERACVEAHLADCFDCRSELALERRLAAEVVALPVETEQAWARMRSQMERAPMLQPTFASQSWSTRMQRRPKRLVWLVAAQAAVIVAIAIPRVALKTEPQYHALSDPRATQTGNVIVAFRPETTEARMRGILNASGARLAGGPTAADAYVLSVPAQSRPAQLRKLRQQTSVVMAEPLDEGITQ